MKFQQLRSKLRNHTTTDSMETRTCVAREYNDRADHLIPDEIYALIEFTP